MTLQITDLAPGDKAVIRGYRESDGKYRRKLLSMGLTKGTEIELLKIAPLGDPVEISLRGFNLSLRKGEADILELERTKK